METKKHVTVTLKVKEIVYDIQNKTYLTGRSREAETSKGYEAASHMQASDDDENSYQIRRSISDAFCDIQSELADYISLETSTADNLVNATVDSDGELTLALSLPTNFQPSAAANLGALLHQYIVNRAIAEWFAITNKIDVPEYIKAADEALALCRRTIHRRKHPTRPLYPAI